jgi:hypothetical protein
VDDRGQRTELRAQLRSEDATRAQSTSQDLHSSNTSHPVTVAAPPRHLQALLLTTHFHSSLLRPPPAACLTPAVTAFESIDRRALQSPPQHCRPLPTVLSRPPFDVMSTVQASHILIKHQDSRRSSLTLTTSLFPPLSLSCFSPPRPPLFVSPGPPVGRIPTARTSQSGRRPRPPFACQICASRSSTGRRISLRWLRRRATARPRRREGTWGRSVGGRCRSRSRTPRTH